MQKSKKVVFRADGNRSIGLGHIYRLLALAEVCSDLEILFVLKESSSVNVIPKQYEVICIPNNTESEPYWFQENLAATEHLIVLDGYQFTSAYQKQLKGFGYGLVYIDDLAKEHMYADIVINHSPFFNQTDFVKEPYTKLALGTKYALLRPLFLKQAKSKKIIKSVDTAFVCFGGADSFDLSLIAAKSLLNIPAFKKINIILGSAYAHTSIFELEVKNPNKIKVYRNLSEADLIEVMQVCNFAIAPASTILYEICCVKMPTLSGFYVDNQKSIYKGLLNKSVIFEGGDFSNYKEEDFEHRIHSILTSNKIDLQVKNQHELFDEKINNRLLGLINQMNISFRKCDENDMLIVFNWSNDEVVRKSSYNSSIIELEDHKSWFEKKINNKKSLFLVALVNKVPAGMVRYEVEDEHSIVGVVVSKEFRGQSLASEFLRKSARLYFKKFNAPILAYIKKENKASINAFKNAKYEYLKEKVVQGSISLIFKLENTNVKK